MTYCEIKYSQKEDIIEFAEMGNIDLMNREVYALKKKKYILYHNIKKNKTITWSKE
jgi:hypothetical protein